MIRNDKDMRQRKQADLESGGSIQLACIRWVAGPGRERVDPQNNLAAEKLINDCGYHRRDEELADAKAAILSR
jgi:hypothetical protein